MSLNPSVGSTTLPVFLRSRPDDSRLPAAGARRRDEDSDSPGGYFRALRGQVGEAAALDTAARFLNVGRSLSHNVMASERAPCVCAECEDIHFSRLEVLLRPP